MLTIYKVIDMQSLIWQAVAVGLAIIADMSSLVWRLLGLSPVVQISVNEAEWEELAALAEEDEAIRLVGAQAQLDDGAPVRQIVVGRVNRHVAVAAEARLVTLLHIELVPGKMERKKLWDNILGLGSHHRY